MRILSAALAVMLTAPVALAQEPDVDGFYRHVTDKGCVFLEDVPPQDFVKGHIWSGNCRRGELISGTGSMITLTDNYVDDRGAQVQDARVRTGPWVNGKMHGRFKFENATSTNGGPWTVIPDDCRESWCLTIFFTINNGVIDNDSAVWGDVDTYAGATPAVPPRMPAAGRGSGTPVQSSGSPVGGGAIKAFAQDAVLTSISLADIERLLIDAGFAPGPSSQNQSFLQAVHPNGIRFLASGLACEDPAVVSGCAGLNLRAEISVKTMQTVLDYPDEPVTWEGINAANANLNLSTAYFDQAKDTVIIKRVLLVGGGGITAGTLKAEISEFPVSVKSVIDRYIWPKG
jgi:hypothetical protein